jgi:superfamily I DNA/RNA helicase
VSTQLSLLPEKKIVWSGFQTAIFDEYRNGTGHVCVEAVPGAGKTKTAIEMIKHAPKGFRGDVLLTSFGRDTVGELKIKAKEEDLPWDTDIRTLNSLGVRAIENARGEIPKLNEQRVYRILDDLLQNFDKDESATTFRARVKALTDLAKAALISDTVGLIELADVYNIDVPPPEPMREQLAAEFGCAWEEALAAVTIRVLEACKINDGHGIDFNDQLWLPVVLDYPVQLFDRVIVDEGQDTNPCQLALIEMATEASGRVFMFGQTEQAIYHWRGAGIGMRPFIERFAAKSMSLSISYRCPKKVVCEATRIVKGMQSAPEAPDGLVERIPLDMLLGRLVIGDTVLSRTNAPLIQLFMKCLSHGIPVGMSGKDIGGRLLKFVDSSKALDVQQLLEYTMKWAEEERERRKKRNPNANTDGVDDHVACIYALCEDTNQILVVKDRIKRMLLAPPDEKVLLSTVHRAKGKEWNRVFLLEETFPVRPAYWRGRASQKKGDVEKWCRDVAARILAEDIEERNIMYVAITRSKQELIYVE